MHYTIYRSSPLVCLDYIRDIDEIRPGFDTLTFDGLLRHQIIHADKVNFSIESL